jgi:predicted NBD/HSP70 family sugar kinase
LYKVKCAVNCQKSRISGIKVLTGSNLKYANSYNLRLVLEMIRLYGPLSRIDIARNTQLTAQTVTNITKKLLKSGLIYESSRQQEGRGAPSIMLKINPDAAYSVGIDFDKDNLTCVLVDLDGNITQRQDLVLDYPSPEEAMRLISCKVEELIELEDIDHKKVWGVGVGFPGPMAVLDGSVGLDAVNPQFYPGWDHVPVVKKLEELLKIPVYLENNAAAAAIGERWYGNGKHVDTFFYIFFGAGLGGGLIIDGQLFPGHKGNAGEIGYFPIVNEYKRPKSNKSKPHLGMYFDLNLLYKKLNKEGFESSTVDDLEKLFYLKNPILLQWLEKGAVQLAYTVLSIEYLIDPEAIFFGGRLPKSMVQKIIMLLKEQLYVLRIPDLKDVPDLQLATAGRHSVALGSATLPFYTSFAPFPGLMMKKAKSDDVQKYEDLLFLNVE